MRFGRLHCGQFEASRRREWLCTNGLGGYAMGSVAGSLERSYHGLLVEATAPPLGRMMRLAKLDPEVIIDGETTALDANAWQGGAVSPDGTALLESFHLDKGMPVWTFLVHGLRLERRLTMVPGRHTTLVSWTLLDEADDVTLRLRALGSWRSHHHTSPDGGPAPSIEANGETLSVQWPEAGAPLRVKCPGGQWQAGDAAVYQGFYLRLEDERGLGHGDSQRYLGQVEVSLTQGKAVIVVATCEEGTVEDGVLGMSKARSYVRDLLAARKKVSRWDPPKVEALVLAADQFIVTRDVDGAPGRTIMAGYPWFGDWGRDTMIALPGLTLATGRPEVAAQILKTFARFVDQGMLPNRFPGAGEPPEYNTVDATMWYFHAIELTVEALSKEEGDALLRQLVPVLDQIVEHHQRGTRYNIRVDDDGLVTSGQEGVQLTWMDARVEGRVITPRYGKPVEINGLWLHGLKALSTFRQRLGMDDAHLQDPIAKAQAAFMRYWNPESGALYDVLDTPEGNNDGSIRPNQFIALGLSSCPLSAEQKRSAVRVAGRHLLTSHGLRSLSPHHPDYVGTYAGPINHRDGSYHQGTVWAWLIGPWVRARLAIGDNPTAIRGDLQPILDQLDDGVIGSVSEIFDGDPPFSLRGAPAQAWSVSETLFGTALMAP